MMITILNVTHYEITTTLRIFNNNQYIYLDMICVYDIQHLFVCFNSFFFFYNNFLLFFIRLREGERK